MKNLKYKIANLKVSDVLKASFSLLLVLFLFLIYFQRTDIQFWINGFNGVFRQEFQVYALSVGQASATLVIADGNAIVIDTGSADAQDDFIEDVRYILKRNKLKEIELLILTHPDADHVGGAESLLSQFQVNNILRPKVLSSRELGEDGWKVVTTITYARAIDAVLREPNCNVEYVGNQNWNFGEVSVQVYPPQLDFYSETNSYSPFIVAEFQEKVFMFTGDAGFEREQEFLDEVGSLDVDCLFVAHHGSKYSTSSKFLQRISPLLAVISAGDSIHPSQEVLERLKDSGVLETYCTKTQGMIALIVKGGVISVETLSFSADLPLLIVIIFCAGMLILGSGLFNISKDRSLFKKNNDKKLCK